MKTLSEIAALVEGELRGDGSVVIERIVHPAVAQEPGDIVLILSEAATPFLETGKIINAIVPAQMTSAAAKNVILVQRPRLVLARLSELFARPVYVPDGVHESAAIHPTAKLGKGIAVGPHCWIGPNSVLGDGSRLVANVSVGAEVEIGENCLIHAGVCVGDRSQIGNRVVLQPNATIGGDGFAFVTPERGSVESARETGKVQNFNTELIRINSIGNVVIEDDVEIGAGSCIDRGTLGETRIGRGTKVDNLVQIGHNAQVGQNCLVVSQVGLGGSSKVGNRAVVGGQAGLPDHLTIGEDAVVHAQAGITNHIPERSVVIGAPAQPKRDFLEREVHLKRLPSIYKTVKELKKRIEELEKKAGEADGTASAGGGS